MGMFQHYTEYAKCRLGEFVRDEKGDTNFISIIVILAIVLVVAGVFIAFGSSIIEWVNENILSQTGLSTYNSKPSNPLGNL